MNIFKMATAVKKKTLFQYEVIMTKDECKYVDISKIYLFLIDTDYTSTLILQENLCKLLRINLKQRPTILGQSDILTDSKSRDLELFIV